MKKVTLKINGDLIIKNGNPMELLKRISFVCYSSPGVRTERDFSVEKLLVENDTVIDGNMTVGELVYLGSSPLEVVCAGGVYVYNN